MSCPTSSVPRRRFLGVLQNWLDSPTRHVGLVVSGSSVRMMHSAVLDSGAPLYGRATEAFAVRPLRAGYLSDVFPQLTPRELVCAYAVWGGMPRYWELAEPFGADIEAAVDALVLDPTGPLHAEPDRLLQAETPPAMALRPLLDVIGNGAHRVSEIAGRLGRPASSLAGPLASLSEMDLVRREIPFGSDPKVREAQPSTRSPTHSCASGSAWSRRTDHCLPTRPARPA